MSTTSSTSEMRTITKSSHAQTQSEPQKNPRSQRSQKVSQKTFQKVEVIEVSEWIWNGFQGGWTNPNTITIVCLNPNSGRQTLWSCQLKLLVEYFVPSLHSCNDARKQGRLVSSPLSKFVKSVQLLGNAKAKAFIHVEGLTRQYLNSSKMNPQLFCFESPKPNAPTRKINSMANRTCK